MNYQFSTIIIGLGQTGVSVARFLDKRNIKFAICDTRERPPQLSVFKQNFPNIPVFCGELDPELLKRMQQLIVSPGVSINAPAIVAAKQAGVELLGDVELFLREINIPVVAVTGSNGKTTVTTLIGEMAKTSNINVTVCGNIGTCVLNTLDKDVDLYILELSSFQLDTINSLTAKVAANLNVSEDHLDRYQNYQAYINAKQRIYRNAEIAVINLDDTVAWQGAELSENKITFSVNQVADFHYTDRQLMHHDEILLSVEKLQIFGKHQIANVLAAFAVGHAIGLSKTAMIEKAMSFIGLPHRCQKIAEYHDIVWVNDSKATNVGATIAAVKSLGKTGLRNIILIAGGDAKNADLSDLRRPIECYCKAIILLGKDARKIANHLLETIEKFFADDLVSAVQTASEIAEQGDIVLLSPACSSLDMFENYIQRGTQFVDAVKKIYD